jgi:hypothetical protein
MMTLIIAFRNFANAPRNACYFTKQICVLNERVSNEFSIKSTFNKNKSGISLFSSLSSRRVRKIPKSDHYLRRVCPCVRMEELGYHWTNFDQI